MRAPYSTPMTMPQATPAKTIDTASIMTIRKSPCTSVIGISELGCHHAYPGLSIGYKSSGQQLKPMGQVGLLSAVTSA